MLLVGSPDERRMDLLDSSQMITRAHKGEWYVYAKVCGGSLVSLTASAAAHPYAFADADLVEVTQFDVAEVDEGNEDSDTLCGMVGIFDAASYPCGGAELLCDAVCAGNVSRGNGLGAGGGLLESRKGGVWGATHAASAGPWRVCVRRSAGVAWQVVVCI